MKICLRNEFLQSEIMVMIFHGFLGFLLTFNNVNRNPENQSLLRAVLSCILNERGEQIRGKQQRKPQTILICARSRAPCTKHFLHVMRMVARLARTFFSTSALINIFVHFFSLPCKMTVVNNLVQAGLKVQ